MRDAARFLVVLACLQPLACDKTEPAPEPAKATSEAPVEPQLDLAEPGPSASGGATLQVPIGDGEEEAHRLPFVITTVFEKQALTDSPPWHKAGGEWLVIDAELEGTPKTTFTFGTKYKMDAESSFGFGDAMLAVPDGDTGKRLVARFSEAFAVPAPPGGKGKAPTKMEFRSAVLGEKVGRFPSGGLGGDGNWIASKLFLQLEGLEGEVFFNFDPVAKQGEFSEKDAEYNADCAKVLALSLSR